MSAIIRLKMLTARGKTRLLPNAAQSLAIRYSYLRTRRSRTSSNVTRSRRFRRSNGRSRRYTTRQIAAVRRTRCSRLPNRPRFPTGAALRRGAVPRSGMRITLVDLFAHARTHARTRNAPSVGVGNFCFALRRTTVSQFA